MKLLRYVLALVLIGLLSACNRADNPNQFSATDISGVEFGQTLNLTDHTGKPRTLQDFKGKVITVFFGYTHCPDVCPTTMADLRKSIKLLGERGNEVQVLFVTLDPKRDTQAVLAQYVPAFDKSFIGLYGNDESTELTIKQFKIFANKVENSGRSGYTIDHSAGIYVYDKLGKIRLYINYGEKPAVIASDIKRLL